MLTLALCVLCFCDPVKISDQNGSALISDQSKPKSKILFAKRQKSGQGWSIYAMRPDGLDLKLLIPLKSGMGEYNPSVSPDGTTILFNTYRFGGWELATFNLHSGKILQLTKGGGYCTNGVFSPDGNKIVYEKNNGRNTHICMADRNGLNERILTSQLGNTENRIPVWTANGNSIIFYSDKEGNNDVYKINISDSNHIITNLTNNKEGNDFAPSVSPDNQQIAFFSDRNGHLDLYVMDISGNNQRNITSSVRNENNAYNYYTDSNTYWMFKSSWSPNGDYLVFTNVASGNVDLFVVHKDGSNLKQITNSEQSELTPVWAVLEDIN